MYATISADVVSSTSLSKEAMIELNERLKKCLSTLELRYQGFWGRIVKGDSIECVMDFPEDAFEAALILKTLVKSFEPSDVNDSKRFNRYGLRIAIGIGEMKTMVGWLLALKPANILIFLILETCKVNINPTKNDEHGNFHSGELIGWLERGLILVFVIMSQYEAIGFLIAAKSILRFSEASKGDEKSEYVLTGTLLSLAIALCLGILVLKMHL